MNSVWVGNVPYEADEDTLKEFMSIVGHVLSVRIRYDKESGQSKGFAFCEYQDPDSCILAVKHLNGAILGGRTIRVDYSSCEQSKALNAEDLNMKNESDTNLAAAMNDYTQFGKLRLSQATREFVETDTMIRISTCRFIEELNFPQLFQILEYMQQLILKFPDLARRLLKENPPLCYAIVHAMFLCGMITKKPEFLTRQDDVLLDRIFESAEQKKQHLKTVLSFHERNLADMEQAMNMMNSTSFSVPTLQDQSSNRTQHPYAQKPITGPTKIAHDYTHSTPYTFPRASTSFDSSEIQNNSSLNLPVHTNQSTCNPPTHNGLTRLTPFNEYESQSNVVPPVTNAEHSGKIQPDLISENIIEQILNRPDLLQQVLSLTHEQEALLAEPERQEIFMIRQALRARESQLSSTRPFIES